MEKNMKKQNKQSLLDEISKKLNRLEKFLGEFKEDIEGNIEDKFDAFMEDIQEELQQIKKDNEDNFETLMGRLGPPGRF